MSSMVGMILRLGKARYILPFDGSSEIWKIDIAIPETILFFQLTLTL
jgi:hypothetical protein